MTKQEILKEKDKLYTNGLTAEKAEKMWGFTVKISGARKTTMTPERAKNIYGVDIDWDLDCLEFCLEYESSTEDGFFMNWAVNWETGQKMLRKMNATNPSGLDGKTVTALGSARTVIEGVVY